MSDHTEPILGPDWASKTAAQIEAGVDAVRSKTVVPAFKIARILSFGLTGAVIGVVVLTLLLVLLIRLLTVYLFAEHVWITYLVLGGISTLAGMLLWSRMGRSEV